MGEKESHLSLQLISVYRCPSMKYTGWYLTLFALTMFASSWWLEHVDNSIIGALWANMELTWLVAGTSWLVQSPQGNGLFTVKKAGVKRLLVDIVQHQRQGRKTSSVRRMCGERLRGVKTAPVLTIGHRSTISGFIIRLESHTLVTTRRKRQRRRRLFCPPDLFATNRLFLRRLPVWKEKAPHIFNPGAPYTSAPILASATKIYLSRWLIDISFHYFHPEKQRLLSLFSRNHLLYLSTTSMFVLPPILNSFPRTILISSLHWMYSKGPTSFTIYSWFRQ